MGYKEVAEKMRKVAEYKKSPEKERWLKLAIYFEKWSGRSNA